MLGIDIHPALRKRRVWARDYHRLHVQVLAFTVELSNCSFLIVGNIAKVRGSPIVSGRGHINLLRVHARMYTLALASSPGSPPPFYARDWYYARRRGRPGRL